jgi:uncharacterized membrane protein
MASIAPVSAARFTFWQKMLGGIALFIVFGFVQFAARGFVDYATVPQYIHIHAVLMVSWLGLSVAQATLVRRDNLALHRRLGWLGVSLAAAVLCVGIFVSIMTAKAHAQPPFFTIPHFLAISQFDVLAFAGLVGAAVIRRRKTEWHRRLMVGAMVMLMEPALGRLLPMPLIVPWGQWLVAAIQLGVLAIVARHDRRTLGAIHPATITTALVVTISHGVVETLAISPFWISWTDRIVGA